MVLKNPDSEIILELQFDFNNGETFDDDAYAETVSQLYAFMGFEEADSLEAAIVSAGKENELETAVQYVLSDSITKAQLRSEAVVKMNKKVPTFDDLDFDMLEVATTRTGIKKTDNAVVQTEALTKHHVEDQRLVLYEEYLKGFILSTPISTDALAEMEEYKKDKNISESEHQIGLRSLGVSSDMWENMISGEETSVKVKKNACMICWSNTRDHIMMECLHVTVCHDCVKKVENSKKCPSCDQPVKKIERVYF